MRRVRFNYNQPATSEIRYGQFWDRAACSDRRSGADQVSRVLLWKGIMANLIGISASHVKSGGRRSVDKYEVVSGRFPLENQKPL